MLILAVFCGCQPLLLAASPPAATARVAPFAPSADLLQQVDTYIDRMDAVLVEPQAFDLAAKSRVVKDANTLAALALVLSLYDEDFPQKAAMPTMLQAARRLATADGNYDAASAALAQIKRARAGMADSDASAKWESVASLSVLMKQVPVIHARLTRGVDRRRLARQAEKSAGESATLAAIAQASIVDTSYAKTPAQAEQWRQYCGEMRDAASEVNAAVHAQDVDRVSAGMKRMLLSCEACHATFRRP
jgi:cytochrome c556